MTLKTASKIHKVYGIDDHERQTAMAFLQGAVYCWNKNKAGEWFALRDLVGGDNKYWVGTPLLAIYKKHEKKAKDPVTEAGKDAGWLLKRVLQDDLRVFESEKQAQVTHYRMITQSITESA